MVAAMANDITIMGLCGETRIANKATSCKFLLFIPMY
jgi:chitin synthase